MLLSDFLPLVTRAITTNYTQAFSVPPTLNWDGNDGGWSTFAIRVGTPPQYFRLLPSTSGIETWVPAADQCALNSARCGVARGVEPFNAAPGASSSSGVPSGVNGSAVDVGDSCTAFMSPNCLSCQSEFGKCTTGKCVGRLCCGDPKGACNSICQGFGGICTGQYIGCPCTGPDYISGPNTNTAAATNTHLAEGFLSSASSTWTQGKPQQIALAQQLGLNSTAQFGTDTVGLGLEEATALTLPSVPVAGVPAYPFYLGTLGLKATTANTSLLSQLFSQKMIPSLSYGYTAGAFYQSPPIFGSLTLGGFDSNRVNRIGTKNLTSNLRANDSSLMVSIGSISISNALSNPKSPISPNSNITALIDTSLPFLYLPTNVCKVFEDAFGLDWDPAKQLYTYNGSVQQKLENLDPVVTFTLIANEPNKTSINLTIPYGALGLGAAYPLFSFGTNYFPLRRANSSSQIILGRAFMQEAYVFVDYETSQYTISQANFPSNPNITNIVTVNHDPNAPTSAGGSSSSQQDGNGLSKGAIAGIVLGTLAAIGLLGALGFFIWRSKHPRHVDEIHRASPSNNSSGSSEPDKEGWSSYSPPPAFQSFRSDREGGMSPDHEKDWGTGDKKVNYTIAGNIQSNGSPTSPVSHGRVVRNVNPWENSELEDPRSPAGATSTTIGAGTNSSMGMFSVFDEKPLPLTPSQMQELPGSATAKEICETRTWDYERGGTQRSNSGSRNGWYGQGRSDNISPVNSGGGTGPSLSGNTRQSSKSSLGSTVASRTPQQRQKHIFELQADEPGNRSRRASDRKRSAAASPTSP